MALDELLAVLEPRLACLQPLPETMLALWLAPGRWELPLMLARRGLVLYLLSGAVLRSRPDVGGRRVDLMVTGDAIRMDDDDSARWRVVSSEPARVALVTPATVTALAGIPGAAQALMLALLEQVELELEVRSIVGIQRIEERIVAFFRLLARRVGQQGASGVRIPLALEQKRIEEMLSAGHTQASMAFRALFGTGVLVHDAAGWLFVPDAWQPRRSSVPNFRLTPLGSGPNSMAVIALSLLPL